MNLRDLSTSLANLCKLAVDIVNLPVAHLQFRRHLDPEHIRETYASYTKPHPRYKLFKHKALGVALIDLRQFDSPEAYLATVKNRGFAGQQRKKAQSRGYTLREINRNDFVHEIHEINISSKIRQGRPMDDSYLEKKTRYDDHRHYRYYGVFNAAGKLVAYCYVATFGNFAATDQLLGYKNNDGVMYFMLGEIICRMIEDGELDYFMYDTYFGAHPGMRDFKTRVGFKPYRGRYSLS